MHDEIATATPFAVQLHPLVALRVASGPANLIGHDGRTAALLQELRLLQETLQDRADDLARRLECCVAEIDDIPLMRALIQVKRDVFNLRSLSPAVLETVGAHVERSVADALSAMQQQITKLRDGRAAMAQVYADEVAQGHEQLRRAWLQRRLNDGIAYSHPELFRELRLLFGSVKKPQERKKLRKLEDTLMQYLLRCVTKLSPLSSFTLMYVGNWENDGGCGIEVAFDDSVRSIVEFKAALAKQLVQPLLAKYEFVRKHFALRLNPSIRMDGDLLVWRSIGPGNISSGRTWGTGESWVQVKLAPVIHCIHHIFAAAGGAALLADALIAAICQLAPKLPPKTVDGVVAELFNKGALVLDNTGFAEQQDPLPAIAALLERLGNENARVHACAVEQRLRAFAKADANGRAALVDDVHRHVSDLAASLGVTLDAKVTNPAFFENCYLPRPKRMLSWASLQSFHSDLGVLLEMAPLLDVHQQVSSQMADFFVEQFGSEGRCLDPESFLRRFDERFRPGHVFGRQPIGSTGPVSEITRSLHAAIESFNALIGRALHSDTDASLDRAEITRILNMLAPEVRARSTSHCFLGQLSQREGEPTKLVINQILGGRSGMLSRFLESVGDQELEAVRRYLKDSSPHARFAALPGVFGFNANRHPRLADAEINVGPFPPGWTDTKKVPLDSLSMTYDPGQHSVCFRDADDIPLDIWYQGFLVPLLMPQVQRTIALAATDGHINVAYSAIMGSGILAGDVVSVLPRVSLGNLVLLRHTYVFPTTFLPLADIEPLDFFVAFQEWHAKHGLPDAFFVRQLPLEVDPGANQSWWNLNPKVMKPFYVRHDNPHLVRLLQKAMKKNKLSLFITEALPALDDHHVTVAGEGHVAEIQFELSRSVRAPASDVNRPIPTPLKAGA
jgi:hypothetical protein